MKKILLALTTVVLLSACAPMTKVTTIDPSIDFPQPTLPDPIQTQDVQVLVINKDQLQTLLDDLKKNPNPSFAIIGVTPEDYNKMISNMQEIQRYILQSQEVIKTYMLYFKSKDPNATAAKTPDVLTAPAPNAPATAIRPQSALTNPDTTGNISVAPKPTFSTTTTVAAPQSIPSITHETSGIQIAAPAASKQLKADRFSKKGKQESETVNLLRLEIERIKAMADTPAVQPNVGQPVEPGVQNDTPTDPSKEWHPGEPVQKRSDLRKSDNETLDQVSPPVRK